MKTRLLLFFLALSPLISVAQNEDLDQIRVDIGKMESTIENVEGIVLKMLDRWNKSDDISQRHREDIVRELNDVTDDLAYLKGRINGKNA